MEKQTWVSRRTSVLEELSCLLWGSVLFGGTLTGYLKSEPLGNLSEAELCQLFTLLRDGTCSSKNSYLQRAILKSLIASIKVAISANNSNINNLPIRQKNQLESWQKKRTSAIKEEIRLCSVKQSWGKTDPVKSLLSASAVDILPDRPRSRSQALQNLKQKIESALYVNTIPPEFRNHFKQDWLPYVSLFFANSLTTNSKIRGALVELTRSFSPGQSSGQLDKNSFSQAPGAVAQLINLLAHPQICLSLVQVIDFDCKSFKQQIRTSLNQTSADALESEEIHHVTREGTSTNQNGTIDQVLSVEINNQTVGQTKPPQLSHSPDSGKMGGDRLLETPRINSQVPPPPPKTLLKPPQIPNPGSALKGSAFNWKCIHTLTAHSDSVVSVAYSANKGETHTLATGSWDKTIQIWALHPRFAQPLLIRSLTAHSASVYSVALSPDGQILASGGVDCAIQLWHLGSIEHTSTGASLMRKLTGHSFPVYSVAFSPDGKLLASGSGDYTIKIWHLQTGKLLSTLVGHSSFVYSVAFSPDGKTLASGSADKSIKIWHISNGQLLTTLMSYAPVNSVAFSPDHRFLVSAGGDEQIKFWQLNSSRLDSDTRLAPRQTLKGHTGEIFSLAFSPRDPILASSSYDKTIKLWNIQTGNLLGTLTGHLHSVHSVAFSLDGMILVSGSHDKTIKLWKPISPLKTS